MYISNIWMKFNAFSLVRNYNYFLIIFSRVIHEMNKKMMIWWCHVTDTVQSSVTSQHPSGHKDVPETSPRHPFGTKGHPQWPKKWSQSCPLTWTFPLPKGHLFFKKLNLVLSSVLSWEIQKTDLVSKFFYFGNLFK